MVEGKMYLQGEYPITEKKELTAGIFSIRLFCPEIASLAKAGQFVHIQVPGFMLRRPLSIAEIDREGGTLRLVFEVRGEGTKVLAQIKKGEKLDLLGPLGNGFHLLSPEKKAVVIGGGIGVPPLLELCNHYGANSKAIIGFRTKHAAVLEEDFRNSGGDILLCTDDGSLGEQGFTTDFLKEELKKKKPDILYGCGPKPMLKIVAECAKESGVRCQLSLEERMACGVGACLGCACKVQDAQGKEAYAHVCKNGPVFEAGEVVFDG